MPSSRASGLEALLNRPEQKSFLQRFLRSPIKSTAQLLHRTFALPPPNSPKNSPPIHIVCISDTHNTQPRLPDGDILIHAGDLTQSGTPQELSTQIEWLHAQPHRHKIVIAGNHELCLDNQKPTKNPPSVDWKSITYLGNTATELEFRDDSHKGMRRVKVFGSPWTPKHGNWAFQYMRTEVEFWERTVDVPRETDILVTHGPPRGHLDVGGLGCPLLLRRLWGLEGRPRLHVFGHVHGGYGVAMAGWDSFQRVYEGVMEGTEGVVGLVKMLGFGVWRALNAYFGKYEQGVTVMVNAAVVGGVRDEKRREALCITL
ncbi:metallophosphatase domain-containing protein [Aspergillus homomorphus CBS 101889]|uniref:Metallo-dependent phosphatase n=1 Tax=Aspergillus homomorphus (strain CBS 101889) TaxID=1450537 RepID=A0A395IBP6_ASPHC|nr:Metallo-dependent phosphatase [Aspergillus homomorphus CBS 101889]RAL17466.1 Metallo-dependent phosphatase [Aspergillus homomorphus CBS 101889]